jgi:glutamine synthetase
MTVLNMIVADQLTKFKKEVDGLITKKNRKEQAILQVLQRYIRESKKIRFEGNNYSHEWLREAGKRGLSNLTSTPEALKAMLKEDAVDIFKRTRVLTEREVKARHEIRLENYTKKIQIESRILGDLAGNHIIPIAIRYQNTLIENVKGLKQVLDLKTYGKLSQNQMEMITEISEHVDKIKTCINEMTEARKNANRIHDPEEKAHAYFVTVLPYFEKIRYHSDKLELLVDDELWPLPKYRELLFIK